MKMPATVFSHNKDPKIMKLKKTMPELNRKATDGQICEKKSVG